LKILKDFEILLKQWVRSFFGVGGVKLMTYRICWWWFWRRRLWRWFWWRCWWWFSLSVALSRSFVFDPFYISFRLLCLVGL